MTSEKIQTLAEDVLEHSKKVAIAKTYDEWVAASDLLDIAEEILKRHDYERLAMKLEILSVSIQSALGIFDNE